MPCGSMPTDLRQSPSDFEIGTATRAPFRLQPTTLRGEHTLLFPITRRFVAWLDFADRGIRNLRLECLVGKAPRACRSQRAPWTPDDQPVSWSSTTSVGFSSGVRCRAGPTVHAHATPPQPVEHGVHPLTARSTATANVDQALPAATECPQIDLSVARNSSPGTFAPE
jgi:hypothetical protein